MHADHSTCMYYDHTSLDIFKRHLDIIKQGIIWTSFADYLGLISDAFGDDPRVIGVIL